MFNITNAPSFLILLKFSFSDHRDCFVKGEAKRKREKTMSMTTYHHAVSVHQGLKDIKHK